MHDFVYQNRVKLLYGDSKFELIGKEAALLGKNALLLTGRTFLRDSGYLDEIFKLLSKSDICVTLFDTITPNPELEQIKAGIEVCKKRNIDLIIGAGGGSVIDSAKAIAAGACVNHDVWKFFTGKKSVTCCLPLLTIPTMIGSGSEMNSAMVITNEKDKIKSGIANRHLFPDTSIVCPFFLKSVSNEQLANSIADIFCHIFETLFSRSESSSPLQTRLLESTFVSVCETHEEIGKNGYSAGSAASLFLASGLSLCGLLQSGLGKLQFHMHLLEHPLSALYDISHGKGLCALISGWLRANKQNNNVYLNSFEKHVLPQLEDIYEQSFDSLHTFILFWLKKNKCPSSLAELHISSDDLPQLSASALRLAKIWRMGKISEEQIYQMYLDSL